jgi:hypothetical protein
MWKFLQQGMRNGAFSRSDRDQADSPKKIFELRYDETNYTLVDVAQHLRSILISKSPISAI